MDNVIVIDDCCTVKVAGLVVMESNTLNCKLINSILQVITSYIYILHQIMIIIHLLSTVDNVIVTDDCCTVKIAGHG